MNVEGAWYSGMLASLSIVFQHLRRNPSMHMFAAIGIIATTMYALVRAVFIIMNEFGRAIISTTIAIGAVYAIRRYRKWRRAIYPRKNIFWNWMLNLNRQEYCDYEGGHRLASGYARNVARRMPIPAMSSSPDHSHGVSASRRKAASAGIVGMARFLGMKPYAVEMAERDQAEGLDGVRNYHWDMDISVKLQHNMLMTQHLAMLIDVDQYMDCNKLLAYLWQPISIYTFQPTAVNRVAKEYSYTFTHVGVSYFVSGGARYHQPSPWNWGVDKVVGYETNWIVSHRISLYNVERIMVDEDHQVINLVPHTRTSLLALHKPEVSRIRRMDIGQGDFGRLHIRSKDTHMVSTGRLGTYNSATITAELDDALATMARANVTKLSTAVVKITTGNMDPSQTAALLEYHRQGQIRPEEFVFPVKPNQTYEFLNKYTDSSRSIPTKPCRKTFMNPLMHGITLPVNSKANDRVAVDYRVLNLQNTGTLEPNVLNAFEAFSDLLVAQVGQTVPVGVDKVNEKQSRPTQRRILEEAQAQVSGEIGDHPKVNTFQKGESYRELKETRIISTIQAFYKLAYSRYMYPLAGLMKQLAWYAFGKNPKEIAERVALICLSCTQLGFDVDMSDHSRMDGRTNNVVRMLEQILMFKIFPVQYHAEIAELLRSQYNQKAKTRHGVRYDTEYTRLSGSPETSLFNTILSAFTAFLSLSDRMSYGEAWKHLAMFGIYGGDDGLTGGVADRIESETATLAAGNSLGQKIKVFYASKDDGVRVNFLSRYYCPEVWGGGKDSCADIGRQTVKFHFCGTEGDRDFRIKKLCEKANALYLTDKNTPVLGDLARLVREVFPGKVVERTKDTTWFARRVEDDNVQWPNENFDNWMDGYFEETMADFDYRKFLQWIELLRPIPLNFDMFGWLTPMQATLDIDDLLNNPTFGGTLVTKPHEHEDVLVTFGDDEQLLEAGKPQQKEEIKDDKGKEDEMPLSHGSDLSKICFDYAKNRKCRHEQAFGEGTCSFQHVFKICDQYLLGKCPYPGDKCWFSHVVEDVSKDGMVEVPPAKEPKNIERNKIETMDKPKGVCTKFQRGKCKAKPCPYEHKLVVCEAAKKSLCKWPKKCWKHHSKGPA